MAEPAAAPATSLPAGTAVVFVSDDHVDLGRTRIGGRFHVHLRDDLTLAGALVAPAGAPTRLLIVDRKKVGDGWQVAVAIDPLRTTAGDLPVRVETPSFPALDPGTAIPSVTLAPIQRVGDALMVRVPVPVTLGNDTPAPAYTPIAAQTPRNRMLSPAPARTPTPVPTPLPTPTATPS